MNILGKLPNELVLSSLAWLDSPRDLARCRSASSALRLLIDSHLPPLLTSVLRRSPVHASCPSPLPNSIDALQEMHLLRGRHKNPATSGGAAAGIMISQPAVVSMLMSPPPNGGGHGHGQQAQDMPAIPLAPTLSASSSFSPTTFLACSSRSYTDTVQIPGTPVLLCSTRHAASPLAALHLSCLSSACAQSPPTASPSATACKVAIALPLPVHDAHTELVGAMCAHPSGRPLVATGSIDGTVKLWTATRVAPTETTNAWAVECLATFRHHRGWAAAVCLSNDLLISSGPDNEIHVYPLQGIATLNDPLIRIRVPIPNDTPFGIFGASISPSGKHLVVMDLDGVAYLYRGCGGSDLDFELKCELSERLTLREARHFEANVRQSFGCLVQVTDHCAFVNSVRVGEVKVYDVWSGEVLYTLSVPTLNPPRSRTVHSFRFVVPPPPPSTGASPAATPASFAANARGFFGLLVTTCVGDLHCFDYSNMPSRIAQPVSIPSRWRIVPAVLTSSSATASTTASAASANEAEMEVEDDDAFAEMPPLISPTHLEDSHEFDFTPAGLHKLGVEEGDEQDGEEVTQASTGRGSRRGQLVVTPRGLRDRDWRHLEVDVDESVAAHVWGLAF